MARTRRTLMVLVVLAALCAGGCASDGGDGSSQKSAVGERGDLGPVRISTKGLHQIPLFISDRGSEREKTVSINETADGYVLEVATPDRTYRIEVTESAPTEASLDAIGPRALPTDDEVAKPDEVEWTTPLGTVSIDAPGASAEDLARIAGSMAVVDDGEFRTFLEDPTADLFTAMPKRTIGSGSRRLEVGFGGSLVDSGAVISVHGPFPEVGFDGPIRLRQGLLQVGETDDGAVGLAVVDHPIAGVEGAKTWWTVDDRLLGRVLVMRTEKPATITIRFSDGAKPFKIKLDPDLWG